MRQDKNHFLHQRGRQFPGLNILISWTSKPHRMNQRGHRVTQSANFCDITKEDCNNGVETEVVGQGCPDLPMWNRTESNSPNHLSSERPAATIVSARRARTTLLVTSQQIFHDIGDARYFIALLEHVHGATPERCKKGFGRLADDAYIRKKYGMVLKM